MSQSYSVQEPDRTVAAAATGRHPLARWTRVVAVWLNRRQGRQDLSSLDDRLLEDIGVSREEALGKAGQPF